MPTLYRRSHLPRQESLRTEPMVYPEELRKHWPSCTGPCQQGRRNCPCPADCEIGADEPRNVYPLSAYWAAFWSGFWRGMSDGARFVFWLLLAILLVAAAWHVAARLAS